MLKVLRVDAVFLPFGIYQVEKKQKRNMMKRKNVWAAIALTMMAAVVAGCSKDDNEQMENKQRTECEYHPFVVEGKQWTSQESTGKDGYTQYYMATYLINGDTVINGDTCKMLWRKENDGQFKIFRYLLERDKKVFVLWQDYRWLTYDFGMAIGSTITQGHDSATLEYVDTLLKDGEMYRRLHVILRFDSEPMHYSGKSVWIEGIGSPSGPLMSYDCHNSGTQNCSINGEIIFRSEDFDLPAWNDSRYY